jgi:acyl carrier protein
MGLRGLMQRESQPVQQSMKPRERMPMYANQDDEVVTTLRLIVSDILNVPTEQITMDAKIANLAHVESIKLLRIAGKIERRFDVELDDESIFRNGTFGDLVSEITELRRIAA